MSTTYFVLIGGAIATFFWLPAKSEASEHLHWGESGDWVIRIDPSNGNGCYMEKLFEEGTLVRVGVTPVDDGAYFSAYNPDWPRDESDAEEIVLFDFGDSRFQGASTRQMLDGIPGGYAFFDNPAFVQEFGKRQSVSVGEPGGEMEVLDLTGSFHAIQVVEKCQSEQ